MTDTMNVGFENYIVFHRGIAEIYIDKTEGETKNHLIVVYQDGTEKDFGDPFGDDARAQAANARTLIDQLQGLIDDHIIDQANDVKEVLEQAITTSQELLKQNETDTKEFNDAVNTIAETKVEKGIQAIEGIQSKEVDGEDGEKVTVYYVDIAKATNDEIDALFDEEE